MAKTRTKLQIDANNLDLQVFRLIEELRSFADKHRADDIHGMSSTIVGLRYRVRKHMHPKDREATI